MYQLTSADIMDLRASVRWQLTSPYDGPAAAPFIIYARESPTSANAPAYHPDTFALHTEGHLRALSDRLEVLGACLRAEWGEPGFVRRILNPAVDCHTASLNPEERASLESRRRFEAKRDRELADEQARSDRRKTASAPQPNPHQTTLSDLFDD